MIHCFDIYIAMEYMTVRGILTITQIDNSSDLSGVVKVTAV